MPRAAVAINRFNAGKLSKLISARTDPQIRPFYDAGAQVMTNWFPMVEGPMIKRSGFRFVKAVRSTATNVALIAFEESADETFILEFSNSGGGDRFVRFIEDGAGVLEASKAIVGSPTAANPVSVSVTSHFYVTGDEVFVVGSGMDELNDRYFSITVTGPNDFTLDGEDGTGRSTGTGGTVARTYEISGLLAADLSILQYVQRKNVMYFVHPDEFPRKLVRSGDLSWAISSVGNDARHFPAFEFDDDSGVTIQASAATGAGITLTASDTIFLASDVGRKFRLTDTTSGIGPVADGGGEGYVTVTAVAAPPSATATANVQIDLDPQVVSSPTSKWARDAWGDVHGLPSSIGIFDDRIWYSGVPGLPGEMWATRIGAQEDFSRLPTDIGGLHFELQAGQGRDVKWIEGIDEVLAVGAGNGEHTVTSIDSDAAIAAGNIKSRLRSRHGSKTGVRPEIVDDRIVFAQRAGRKLRDFQYRVELNQLESVNLTRLSREITADEIARLSFQQEPNRILWVQMEDGSLAALTHETSELVTAWADVELGGSGLLDSSVALPSKTSTTDEFYAVVTRTIDGGPTKYIELLQPFWEENTAIEDAFFLDSAIQYDGSPVTDFVGANHLEGETVACFADGFRIGDVTIIDGAFSLPATASKVLVGYEYTCQYLSMPLEGGSADGTSQGKKGSIARMTLRLDQAGDGLRYGNTLDDLRPVEFRVVGHPMDVPVPLFDGDKNDLIMPMNQVSRRTVALEHSGALPCTVLGAFPRLEAR